MFVGVVRLLRLFSKRLHGSFLDWVGNSLIRGKEVENTIENMTKTIEINQLEKLKLVRNIEEFTEFSEDSTYNK